MKNKIVSMALAALMLFSCTGCGADSSDGPSPNSAAEETFTTSAPIVQPDSGETDVEALVEAGLFSNRDFRTEYDAFSAVEIELGDSGIKCSSPAVKVEGNTVTLSLEGTYVLSGSISDGMVIIDAANTDKIQLVLNNASITSQTSAPIYIKQADKVFLTLAENSENELINGGSFDTIDDSNIDAAIFARDDLTINGSGSLTVSSPAGHGIAVLPEGIVGEAISQGILKSLTIADASMTRTHYLLIHKNKRFNTLCQAAFDLLIQ